MCFCFSTLPPRAHINIHIKFCSLFCSLLIVFYYLFKYLILSSALMACATNKFWAFCSFSVLFLVKTLIKRQKKEYLWILCKFYVIVPARNFPRGINWVSPPTSDSLTCCVFSVSSSALLTPLILNSRCLLPLIFSKLSMGLSDSNLINSWSVLSCSV